MAKKSDRFIVLSLGEEVPEDDGARGGRPRFDAQPGGRPRAGGAKKLKVEVRKLGGSDRQQIEDSPRHFAARPMPIRLIKPMAGSRKKVKKSATTVQWGVTAVGADQSARSGSGVVVAVLDTGIAKDYKTHPAFKGVQVDLRNFTDGPDHDTDGHGTHCAGALDEPAEHALDDRTQRAVLLCEALGVHAEELLDVLLDEAVKR